MIKCLCIGDMHYKKNNLADLEKVTAEIKNIIEQERPSVIVGLGDWMDTHDKTYIAVRVACIDFMNYLTSACELFIALIGNHDRPNNLINTGKAHFFTHPGGEDPKCVIVDEPKLIEFKGAKFACLPYINPKDLMSVINATTFGDEMILRGGADVVFAHQEVYGCKFNQYTMSEAKEASWQPKYTPMISGHIHDCQWTGNVFYTGTPLQHTFGESYDKYIAIVDINTASRATTASDCEVFELANGTLKCRNLECRLLQMHGPRKLKQVLTADQIIPFMQTVRIDDYVDLKIMVENELMFANTQLYLELKARNRLKFHTVSTVVHEAVCKVPKKIQSYSEYLRSLLQPEDPICKRILEII